MKKISFYKMSYFSQPYSQSKKEIKVELDLFDYVTKSDVAKATGVNISDFAKKYDSATGDNSLSPKLKWILIQK